MLRSKAVLQLILLLFIGSSIVAGVYLVQQRQEIRKKAAIEVINADKWYLLFDNWPIDNPDSISFRTLSDGKIEQLLIKNKTWWARIYPEQSWYTGTIFSEGSTSGIQLPDSIDSDEVYKLGNDTWHIVTKDSKWYAQTNSGPWNYSGNMFQDETTNCQYNGSSRDLPRDKIDTVTIFPSGSDHGMIVTSDGFYWWKESIDSSNPKSKIWNRCGVSINNSNVTKFSGHTAFMFNGVLAEVYTYEDTYWFFPNINNRDTLFNGTLSTPVLSLNPNNILDSTISPYIFGANLVWHEPHNNFYNSSNNKEIAEIIKDLGITLLRFPGGCGGDGYNWKNTNHPNNKLGSSIDDFLEISYYSGAEPYYTLNIEGTTHANLNCHNLWDHPGSIAEAEELFRELKNNPDQKYRPINHVEISNEPYAKGYPNWDETWTKSTYSNTFNQFANALKTINPDLKITAATGGKTDWESAVNSSNVHAYQYHPYFSSNWTGNSGDDNPLTQARKTDQLLKNARTRHNKKLALTEYNLLCWSGIPYDYGQSKNPYVDTMGHAIYVAQMLKTFVENDVEYAAIWHLFDDNTQSTYTAIDYSNTSKTKQYSSWKCGLIRDYGSGYEYTPSAKSFKLIANNIRSKRIQYANNQDSLDVIATKDNYSITALVINPTEFYTYFRFDPGVDINKDLELITLSAPNLSNSNEIDLSSDTLNSTNNQYFDVNVKPWSVNILNYHISTRPKPSPIPTLKPTSTPTKVPTPTPTSPPNCSAPNPTITATCNSNYRNDLRCSWNSVSGATEYRGQIDNNSDFSSPIVNTTGSSTSRSVGNVTASRTYYCRARVTRSNGTCTVDSKWSSVVTVKKACPTPIPSPTDTPTPTPTKKPSPTSGCQPGSVPGDANGDCSVDGFDYVLWWQNFGNNVSGGYTQGDFNNNGSVDGFDYVLWWQNFGS